ncbi:MAG: FHA domain-containing protein [Clostridia bacterium]|nr:FHA domain-containing protein [Clostridia bacterium]
MSKYSIKGMSVTDNVTTAAYAGLLFRIGLALMILIFILISLLLLFHRNYGKNVIARFTNNMNGKTMDISSWEVSIGRAKTCDIVLNYSTVSRFHAVVARRGKGWMIFDTGSKSGVFVNGNKIDKYAYIYDGDDIEMGTASLRFCSPLFRRPEMTQEQEREAPKPSRLQRPKSQRTRKPAPPAKKSAAPALNKSEKQSAAPVQNSSTKQSAAPVQNKSAKQNAAHTQNSSTKQSAAPAQNLNAKQNAAPAQSYSAKQSAAPAQNLNAKQSAAPKMQSPRAGELRTESQAAAGEQQKSVLTRRAGGGYISALRNMADRALILLFANEYVIGRTQECGITLPVMTVSRRHARLAKRDGRWTITDLDSKGGVYINNSKEKGTIYLYDGDVINIGGVRFRYIEKYMEE